jgi:hypothetical protein
MASEPRLVQDKEASILQQRSSIEIAVADLVRVLNVIERRNRHQFRYSQN